MDAFTVKALREPTGQPIHDAEARKRPIVSKRGPPVFVAAPFEEARLRKGVDVPGLKAKSGFEDKKIRNIIFRLSKQGTIKRVGRGLYAIR